MKKRSSSSLTDVWRLGGGFLLKAVVFHPVEVARTAYMYMFMSECATVCIGLLAMV